MYETTVTLVGNVLNPPDCRRLEDGESLVTHFKVASTSRRFDRAEERWTDGRSLRVRVNCWRQLAENVARSVQVGDPVIVTGRLYSRDWETSDHVRRVSYELDASAVGHDLARGRARFARVKPATATSAIEDEQADARIGEAPTTPADDINGLPRRRVFDEDLGGYVTVVEERDPFADELLNTLDADGAAPFEGSSDDLARELEALADAEPLSSPPSAHDLPEPEEDATAPSEDPEEAEESDEAEQPDGDPEETGTPGRRTPARTRRPTRSRVTAGV
jgi:single-strand DNA-binding protein